MAPPATSEPECLIIGCGYLGRRVATRWAAAGRRVAALTRGNADTLRNLGVEPVVGDVLDPASLRRLPAADTVLYAVATDRTSASARASSRSAGCASSSWSTTSAVAISSAPRTVTSPGSPGPAPTR